MAFAAASKAAAELRETGDFSGLAARVEPEVWLD